MNKTQLTELPPLSLYIHIPWCVRKCPYCDFNSHTADTIPEQQYVKALIEDLKQDITFVQGRKLQSIFFGGGTPSLFSAKAISSILNSVEKHIPFSDDIEITLEANPGTAEQENFCGYYSAGVNRLSIGVQSFNPQQLKSLGRIHDNAEAIAAAQAARHAGFDNVNIDLMHGLPGQTQTESLQDIQQAIDLAPTHISWYQLTIEPNTVFYNHPPQLPSDDQLADIQSAGEQLLADNQFNQYEISAYCQTQRPSKHNMNYWLFGDYIGIGAGAHSKITSLHNQTIQRFWKTRSPKDYLAANEEPTGKKLIAGEKTLSYEDMPVEFMMNSMRLINGFERDLFQQRSGRPIQSITAILSDLSTRGLLKQEDGNIAPTALGRRFLNDILAAF